MLKVTTPYSHLLIQEKVVYCVTYLGRMLGTVPNMKGTAEEPEPTDGSCNSEVIFFSATQIIPVSVSFAYFSEKTLSSYSS